MRRSRDLDLRILSILSADFDLDRLFDLERDLLRFDILRRRVLLPSDSALEIGS